MKWYLALMPLIFILYPLWEARIDFKAIRDDGSQDSLGFKWHRQSATVTGLVILAVSAPALWMNAWIFLLTVFYLSSLFWIFFDARLNRLRDLPLLYVGYTSRSEKLLRKISKSPEDVLWVIKMACIMASSFLYYDSWT